MTEDQARALFRSNCSVGPNGALERHGEKAAVAAIMAAVSGLTLRCPKCRKEMPTARSADDPAQAALMEIICPDCDDGDRHEPRYFRADGSELLFGRDFGMPGAGSAS